MRRETRYFGWWPNTLLREVRQGDTVYRYGGEEFVLVLPAQSIDSAAVAAQRLRWAIESQRIPYAGHDAVGHLTLSIGVAEMVCGAGTNQDALLVQADEALYRAKSLGRNRVCMYCPTGIEMVKSLRAM